MQAFEYIPAATVNEAVTILAREGAQACVLSGGTDLIVQLREGRRKVQTVVDIKHIPEVNELSYDPATGLLIGAAVPCYRIYSDPAIAAAYPGLIDAVSLIGGVQVQGRASLGGNLCNASPAADTIPALIVQQAVAIVMSENGERRIPIEQFCTAPGRTQLQRGELLLSIHVPPVSPRSGCAYLRFIPRNEMDIAVVGVGAWVALNEARTTITSARIALGAVAPTPLYVPEAGASLVGKPVAPQAIEEAAVIAQTAAKPISDMRGSAAQRKHLVAVLTRRALQIAIERASA
jgi:CO/xanthine dehydrogenase FAD-binding subunit